MLDYELTKETSLLVLTWIIIPIVFIIGIITTIEDYQEGKIRNKWIKQGITYGLIYYAAMILITIIGTFKLDQHISYITQNFTYSYTYFEFSYYVWVIVNTAIAFVGGFLLWHLKLWTGGDAKLFSLYVFLIPLGFYSQAYIPIFPALALLINISIPIFIYVLLKMLWYPIKMGINYLRKPELLKTYINEYRKEHPVTKKKLKTYLSTALSFIVLMIFFRLIRDYIMVVIEPHLGGMILLVTAMYFLLGFIVFSPIQKIFNKGKRVYIILIVVIAYFVSGAIWFKDNMLAELGNIFALQMIFMMSYYYIFKYGKRFSQLLYNSTDIKMIPVTDLGPGLFINKAYLKNVMGDRTDVPGLHSRLEQKLNNDEFQSVKQLIERKTDAAQKEKEQYKLVSILKSLHPSAFPNVIKDAHGMIRQRKKDRALFKSIQSKLDQEDKEQLEHIMHNRSEIKAFLRKIKGRITHEQAQELKRMIHERNQEVSEQGHDPIEHIILHKPFSFAPFMLFGVIITIITKSSIIHMAIEYFLNT